MTASDNKLIDMIMEYLNKNNNGEIEASYYNRWNNTPFEEIQEWIVDSVNINVLYDNYPELSLKCISADTLLEIQNVLIKEYEFEFIGDVLYKKDELLTLYMGSDFVVDIITKKYDIIKIQRLWRGYDCRWKNPFLMLKC
tara:strand:- start:53 stop:472 length:420 start_codon:yes stop_codon:yes gene_type:complete